MGHKIGDQATLSARQLMELRSPTPHTNPFSDYVEVPEGATKESLTAQLRADLEAFFRSDQTGANREALREWVMVASLPLHKAFFPKEHKDAGFS